MTAIKIWLIVAASMILLGGILFVGALAVERGFDFRKLGTMGIVTNEYTPTEEFDQIIIKSDTADLSILPAEGDACRVVCREEEKLKHQVSVQDGTLKIDLLDERRWYDFIGFHFGSTSVTVYLPEKEYKALTVESDTSDVTLAEEFTFGSASISVSTGDVQCHASVVEKLKIRTSTGKIHAEEMSAGEIELSVSTGNVTLYDVECRGALGIKVSTGDSDLTDVRCGSLSSTGSTGDLSMTKVIAKDFSIERSTGDVTLDGCDAETLWIKTDTGDVTGTLLSDKIFMAQSDTGKVEVPKSTSGGVCEVSTDTGKILLSVRGA